MTPEERTQKIKQLEADCNKIARELDENPMLIFNGHLVEHAKKSTELKLLLATPTSE